MIFADFIHLHSFHIYGWSVAWVGGWDDVDWMGGRKRWVGCVGLGGIGTWDGMINFV